jgi:hypothetical protein
LDFDLLYSLDFFSALDHLYSLYSLDSLYSIALHDPLYRRNKGTAQILKLILFYSKSEIHLKCGIQRKVSKTKF